MSQVNIFHNPNCSKSRATKQILEDQQIDHTVLEYLGNVINKAELESVLTLLNMQPRDLMRKGEGVYTEKNLDDQSLSRDDLVDAMIKNPVLIERPIVIANGKAIIARPPERVLDIL